MPVPDRFPSAADGAGFKPLADWVHSQGLKFGIHIMRGIPRRVGRAEPAHRRKQLPCRGRRRYLRRLRLGRRQLGHPRQRRRPGLLQFRCCGSTRSWGVDFIKVDCIADHPYQPTEIRQIAAAIAKTGRPIVLSLSPGPTQLEHAAEIARYAQMWRISNDIWDGWHFHDNPQTDEYPGRRRHRVRQSRQMESACEARHLAGCRHAPVRLAPAASRNGRSAGFAAQPRGTADPIHAYGPSPVRR